MEGSLHLRYPFAPINGAFLFVTDLGCFYTIELSDKHEKFLDHDILNNDGKSFEISIGRVAENEDEEAYDEAVSSTILYILGTNIASQGDVSTFFYVCDTDNNEGKLRARKFNIWFYKLKKELPNLEKHNFIIQGYDNEEFDISLLIFNNHPYKEEYIKEFEDYLSTNFSKN